MKYKIELSSIDQFEDQWDDDMLTMLEGRRKRIQMSIVEVKDFYKLNDDLRRMVCKKVQQDNKNFGHVIYDTWDGKGKWLAFKLIITMLNRFNKIYIDSLTAKPRINSENAFKTERKVQY